jgi:hypothetical protein
MTIRMPLTYLEFDRSEDIQGLVSWSALACPAAEHTPALHREVQALIEDLTRLLGAAGPVDEGHAWDMALDIGLEADRTAVSLHLSGGGALTECLNRWIEA